MTNPFKISLVIEKNGYSCINVILMEVKILAKREEPKNNSFQPYKEKRSRIDVQ